MNLELLPTFDGHAVAMFVERLSLSEVVEVIDREFDVETGVVAFGLERDWNAQVPGRPSSLTVRGTDSAQTLMTTAG